ncbi:MAG: metallophosphoesterase [Clostridia bacterium]|nr:metallophosphoesterase [Clostridia bacterium]
MTAKKKMKKPIKILLWTVLMLAVLAGLAQFTYWGNTTVATGRYTVSSEKIPEEFDGYKIAQVSDLHDACFGEDNSVLIDILEKEKPDMIALTGDIFDFRRLNIERSLSFVRRAVRIAPCYYVSGNHEEQLHNGFPKFLQQLRDEGVTTLMDEYTTVEKGGAQIVVMGVIDPLSAPKLNDLGVSGVIDHALTEIENAAPEGYTVLLSHRPEVFRVYVDHKIDLALCGHAHGGQIRLPIIGGLYGPGQGLFPKYDAGRFTKDGTTMILSRGIGNSGFPVRFNNRPEIVIVELNTVEG